MVDEVQHAAAVADAIKQVTVAPPSEPPAAPEGGDNGNPDPNPSGDPSVPGAGAGEGAEAGAGDGSAPGDTGGEAGKPAGSDAAGGAADGDPARKVPAKEGTPGAAGVPDPKARKPQPTDPVASDARKEGERGYDKLLDEPLPNALRAETKDRIRGLVTRVKEAETRISESDGRFEQLFTAIEQTGATPQQYSDALTWLKLVNSGDRKARETALQIMQAEVAELAMDLGIPVPGVNMLEGHQDLINEIGAGKITLARAQEIAAARNSQARAVRRSQNQNEQTREAQQRRAAVQQGIRDLDALGERLKADPDFARRAAIVKAQLQPVFKTAHPSRWVEMFERAYRALPPLPPAAANGGGTTPRVPQNQPIRPNNPPSAPVAEPKTAEEAVRKALGLR